MNTIRMVHLLDDFTMGGVVTGLRVFNHPAIANIAVSETIQIDPHRWTAPALNADIITINFPPRWKGLTFLHALRRRNPGAHIIHVEHSYCREWAALHVPDMRRFCAVLKMAFRCCNSVVSVSKAQAAWLIETGAIAADKLHVIYPYSRDQGLNAVPAIQRKAGEPIVVGSYGRFCEAKGYERLIAAFKRLDANDETQLVLGGTGELDASLRHLAQGCDKIRFVGHVNDTAAFMRGIHVFAVPSLYETFGQVASEAREAGRPLLVSEAGGLPEQAGSAGIIINCDSEDELLMALRVLQILPLETMGRLGRKAVQQCIENRITGWQNLLLSAVKQPVHCQSRA